MLRHNGCDSNLDVLQSEYKTGVNCRYWQQISDVSDGSGGTKYNKFFDENNKQKRQ